MYQEDKLNSLAIFQIVDLPLSRNFGPPYLHFLAELHPGFYICYRAKNSLSGVIFAISGELAICLHFFD